MDHHSAFGILHMNFLLLSSAAVTVLIISVLVLLIFSFILSGSEVAFFSLSPKDINILKTRKHPSIKRVVSLLEEPKTLLGVMLVVNSFINIGIILITNLLIENWLEVEIFNSPLLHFLMKVVVVSFLLVLFAEVLPKVWATHHKVWFASMSSLIVEVFYSIFYKLSKRFVGYSDNIEKRISPQSGATLDNNNLDYAIDLLPEDEASNEEKQILKGIRKFGDTSVKQVMRTRLDVSGIPAELSFHALIKLTEDLHYSRLPVYKKNLDEILGVLHIKDLLPYLHESDSFDWHPFIRKPYFVHEQKMIEDLLQEFRSKHIHFAVIVDEFGGTSGIVTLEDIIEEVIGDIKDEFDDEESGNKKIDDYNYLFEGKTMINDICSVMNIPISTFEKVRGDSNSIAGLVLEISGAFPPIGQEFVFGNYTFSALEINKNRIDKVKVVVKHQQEIN